MSHEFLGASEVRYRLAMGSAGLEDCVRLGLLTPVEGKEEVCYTEEDVAAFEAQYVPRLVAMHQLGLTIPKLKGWIRHGYLRTIKLGPFSYYRKEEVTKLKKFLEEHLLISDAAREFSFSNDWLRSVIRSGAVNRVWVGGQSYVVRAEVQKLNGPKLLGPKRTRYTRAHVANELGLSVKQVEFLARQGYLGDEKTSSGLLRYSPDTARGFLATYGDAEFYIAMKKRHRAAQ